MSCKHIPLKPGTVMGRLTILNVPTRLKGKGNYQYFCECSCGNTGWFYSHKLKSGHTISCGCYRSEEIAKRNISIEYRQLAFNHLDLAIINRFGRPLIKQYYNI